MGIPSPSPSPPPSLLRAQEYRISAALVVDWWGKGHTRYNGPMNLISFLSLPSLPSWRCAGVVTCYATNFVLFYTGIARLFCPLAGSTQYKCPFFSFTKSRRPNPPASLLGRGIDSAEKAICCPLFCFPFPGTRAPSTNYVTLAALFSYCALARLIRTLSFMQRTLSVFFINSLA